MFLSLLLVCGADPVPTFQVENRIPPSFKVVNRVPPKADKPQTVPGVAPRPGEPVQVTPGVVINRPFSGVIVGTPAPAKSGTEQPTSGVTQWSQPSAGTWGGSTSTVRVLVVGRSGLIENCTSYG